MAGWMGRAAEAWRRSTTPAPQPFQLPCDCGETLTGWRTESHQRLPCPACRQTHLILPGNVYPAVKRSLAAPPPQKPAPTTSKERTKPEPKRTDRKSPRRAGKRRDDSDAAQESAVAAQATDTEPELARIDLSPTLHAGRNRQRRLRLIVVCITALLAVTCWSLWSRARREHARATVPVASKAGIDALRRGDFTTAKRELTLAVDGLNTLRRHDDAALAIRQAHREAVAGEGLWPKDFPAVAEEFVDGIGDEEARRRRFRSESGSKWLLFDADLTRSSTSAYEFDVPLAMQTQTLQIACDFPELRRLAAETPAGQSVRVIFAAQIDDWETAAERKLVVARLRSASALLWTDYEAYVAAGYRADTSDPESEAETRAILSTQRQLVAP